MYNTFTSASELISEAKSTGSINGHELGGGVYRPSAEVRSLDSPRSYNSLNNYIYEKSDWTLSHRKQDRAYAAKYSTVDYKKEEIK